MIARAERGKYSRIFHNAVLKKCGQPVGGCGIWIIVRRTVNGITNPVVVLDIILYKKIFKIEIDVYKDSCTQY